MNGEDKRMDKAKVKAFLTELAILSKKYEICLAQGGLHEWIPKERLHLYATDSDLKNLTLYSVNAIHKDWDLAGNPVDFSQPSEP